MSDEADPAAARGGRHRSVLLAGGAAIVVVAVLLLAAPALPGAVRWGAALLALVGGIALVAVALLPSIGVAWLRPVFWGLLAALAVPVAIAGGDALRLPAVLMGVLALAQCALGVVLWRRRSAA